MEIDTDPMKSLQKQVLILNLITRVLGVQDASIEVERDSLMKVLSQWRILSNCQPILQKPQLNKQIHYTTYDHLKLSSITLTHSLENQLRHSIAQFASSYNLRDRHNCLAWLYTTVVEFLDDVCKIVERLVR